MVRPQIGRTHLRRAHLRFAELGLFSSSTVFVSAKVRLYLVMRLTVDRKLAQWFDGWYGIDAPSPFALMMALVGKCKNMFVFFFPLQWRMM